ncbi:MAG TPA: allantoinase AllB [Candidatus Dormibacteraeota bacterium]|nr:allantoinase AllB [Candidatus Dormibacteraeota bacterium]
MTARGESVADIAVRGGRIEEVGTDLAVGTAEVIDAAGLHVLPGGIDSHVHLNEPGRTEWEDIAHGSAALAAGGYTTFIDMPLNNLPVTTTADAFDLKLEAMRRSSLLDFRLWGGLVPGNLDQLRPLAERGVAGFKAFMCPSGIDEFPACDEDTLKEGMKRIAGLGSILLVHAELPAALRVGVAGAGALDFIRSRPPEAEVQAIFAAVSLAQLTGCRLHIVHVSTARGAELITQAQRAGADVTGETCAHYLIYAEDDLERLGGAGKCAPPFRTRADCRALWSRLRDGTMPMVVSDHSPSTRRLKQGDDFSQIWGGISGCQTTRQLLLGQGLLDLPTIAAATSTNIARRFGIGHKGDIAPGFDADLWLVDLGHRGVVRREDLLYKNQFSAHEGQPVRGRTVRTLLRGRTVTPGDAAAGRLVPPE